MLSRRSIDLWVHETRSTRCSSDRVWAYPSAVERCNQGSDSSQCWSNGAADRSPWAPNAFCTHADGSPILCEDRFLGGYDGIIDALGRAGRFTVWYSRCVSGAVCGVESFIRVGVYRGPVPPIDGRPLVRSHPCEGISALPPRGCGRPQQALATSIGFASFDWKSCELTTFPVVLLPS
jgi:hypothetical protein